MLHDNKKKTIYYDNAVVKFTIFQYFIFPNYLIPIQQWKEDLVFYLHQFSDTKNLGIGLSVPYFFALDDDKNFTLTNRFYVSENPLFFGEYHQAFKNSSFLADFGFTEGYKNTSASKKPGHKSHFLQNL